MLPTLAQMAASAAATSNSRMASIGPRILELLQKSRNGMTAREIAEALDIEQVQRIDDALYRLGKARRVCRKHDKRCRAIPGRKTWVYFAGVKA
jgi:predicted Zn-ribbon and HTH transcriptional regulator